MIPILWTRWLPDGGIVQWIPGDLERLPIVCMCGGAFTGAVSDESGPIEMICEYQHRWRSALAELQERIARHQRASAGFTVGPDGKSITCHRCGMTSCSPADVRERFCGKCNVFHQPAEGAGG